MCSYPSGCRCDDCKAKHRERMRTYVTKRRAVEPNYYSGKGEKKIICNECSAIAFVDKRSTFCSRSCAVAYGNRKRPPRPPQPPKLVQCRWCHGLHFTKNTYCGPDCKQAAAEARADTQRHPLRTALITRDMDALRVELLKKVTIDGDCWLWPILDRHGYPRAPGSGQPFLHRLIIQATHGALLGSQQAHHKCGQSACVNPDHLQPVTHRENLAEMLTRRSYLSRITELENALREMAPNHPLLTVIKVV